MRIISHRDIPYSKILRASLLCGILMFCYGFLSAEAITPEKGAIPVTVRVEAKPDPVRAVGLVFSTKSSKPIPETIIRKIGDKLFEIEFLVPRAEVQTDSVATAIAYDETGNTFFANVTPALLENTREIISAIPECPGQKADQPALLNGPGTLKQLVDFRSERVELLRLKITRAMNPTLLAKLQKFEEAFGLVRSSPLNGDLPPHELIDRLSRLQHALKKFQMEKPKLHK